MKTRVIGITETSRDVWRVTFNGLVLGDSRGYRRAEALAEAKSFVGLDGDWGPNGWVEMENVLDPALVEAPAEEVAQVEKARPDPAKSAKAKQVTFWVYPIVNGFKRTRWVYATESTLFPGRRSVVMNNWADKRGAVAGIRRSYKAEAIGTIHFCECPFPAATAEERQNYRTTGRA